MDMTILDVKDLRVKYNSDFGEFIAVDNVNFKLNKGDILGIFGESGCGKSSIVRSIIRLLPQSGKIINGKILYKNEDLLKASLRRLREIRGEEISFILQNPLASFDPLFTIQSNFFETLTAHSNISKKDARLRAIKMLETVRIAAPEKRIHQYPFEMSGGMLQRIMIALAFINKPEIIIADEPSTALDVTTQAGILMEMNNLNIEYGVTFILVSHDITVINQISNKILVMYAGSCVEVGSKKDVLKNTLHPYTKDLINCIPTIDHGYLQTKLKYISGQPPDLLNLSVGCNYCERCSFAMNICFEKKPPLTEIDSSHFVSCFLYANRAGN